MFDCPHLHRFFLCPPDLISQPPSFTHRSIRDGESMLLHLFTAFLEVLP
jgi:hypothetical protein